MSLSMRTKKSSPMEDRNKNVKETTLDESPIERDKWESNYQFLAVCIGFTVGLGNVWRFPKLVFENGGGTFLLVYLIVNFLFGFPLLYLELSLGQFSRFGPALAYGQMSQVFQGIGWIMIFISVFTSFSYNIVISWTFYYILKIFSFQFEQVYICNNTEVSNWHENRNLTCFDTFNNLHEAESARAVTASEVFFEKHVLNLNAPSPNGMQWVLFAINIFIWVLVGLILFKGLKVYARISYVFAFAPYFIIVIFVLHGLMLRGSSDGVTFLLKPDLKKFMHMKTWTEAAKHNVYSLSVALGGLLTFASYNNRSLKLFKYAFIINCSDFVMSFLASISAFSVIGSLAFIQNKEIDEVLTGGMELAFVIYPTAIGFLHKSSVVLAYMFGFLFFAMLFLLGLSSTVGLSEVVISGIIDIFPKFRRYRHFVVLISCIVFFLNSIIMTTRSGLFFFQIYETYSNSVIVLFSTLILETVLVCYVYGCANYFDDLRAILGTPRTLLHKVFGGSGLYVAITWMFCCPLIAAFVVYHEIRRIEFPLELLPVRGAVKCTDFNRDISECRYDHYHYIIAAFLSSGPLLFGLGVTIYYFLIYHQDGILSQLCAIQESWPSYEYRVSQNISWLRKSFFIFGENSVILSDSESSLESDENDEDEDEEEDGELDSEVARS